MKCIQYSVIHLALLSNTSGAAYQSSYQPRPQPRVAGPRVSSPRPFHTVVFCRLILPVSGHHCVRIRDSGTARHPSAGPFLSYVVPAMLLHSGISLFFGNFYHFYIWILVKKRSIWFYMTTLLCWFKGSVHMFTAIYSPFLSYVKGNCDARVAYQKIQSLPKSGKQNAHNKQNGLPQLTFGERQNYNHNAIVPINKLQMREIKGTAIGLLLLPSLASIKVAQLPIH